MKSPRPSPLVSIIIPSGGLRPSYLEQAIKSATLPTLGSNIEIIVVFNGPPSSKHSLPSLTATELHCISIQKANANAARNAGMSMARGTFIRFLDDDDLIDREGAMEAYDLLSETSADVVSGSVRFIDDNGAPFGEWKQPEHDDLASAMMSQRRMSQLTAHIFRREAVKNTHFNENLSHTQDIDWLLRVASDQSIQWKKTTIPMGDWRRHTGQRISTAARLNERKTLIAEGILSLLEELSIQQSGLSREQSIAAASGLWGCVYSSLFMHPVYWTRVALKANMLSPGSHPDIPMHGLLAKSPIPIPALLVEWLLIPVRALLYLYRRIMLRIGSKKFW